ncbi:hypothetical protein RsoM2USA_244 [Ralstonia phage RsoM2USA]|nr:hypothetical protein RsoM2USA_244 [Ralstonia phage RsoM2USA]
MNTIQFSPRNRSGGFDVIVEPFGPVGYAVLWDVKGSLFARFPMWDDYRGLNTTHGSSSVYNLIRIGLKHQIADISEAEIEAVWKDIMNKNLLKF